ncbi:hypothetical protein CIG19_02325 [Enterobacterales bacterium CwR94]|nr:hypothetical protein CIG19_02325 [Enterobacterales bacterium CwR94]
MVLDAVNARLHKNALVRNTTLKEKSILDVSVSFSKVSNSVMRQDKSLTCWASAALKVDPNVTQLLSSENLKYSLVAQQIVADYLPSSAVNLTENNEDSLSFAGFQYDVFANDDGTLKEVDFDAHDRSSYAIYGIAWFNENAKIIKNEMIKNAFSEAKEDFTRADDNINTLYSALPELIQHNLRGEMRNWIKQKDRKCGKVELLATADISLTEKTKIYRCQTEMTAMQIERLTE